MTQTRSDCAKRSHAALCAIVLLTRLQQRGGIAAARICARQIVMDATALGAAVGEAQQGVEVRCGGWRLEEEGRQAAALGRWLQRRARE